MFFFAMPKFHDYGTFSKFWKHSLLIFWWQDIYYEILVLGFFRNSDAMMYLCLVEESLSPSCHLSLFVIQWRTFSLDGTGGGAIKELADVSPSKHKPLSPKSPPFLLTTPVPTLTTPLPLRLKWRSLLLSPMSNIAPESAENVDPFSISYRSNAISIRTNKFNVKPMNEDKYFIRGIHRWNGC